MRLKKLQIYIISSSDSSSITFISSLISSSSEAEMNRFTASLSSNKIESWEFSFCLLALQGSPFFKQWIKSSSLPSFTRFKPQHLNNFIMFYLDSWDQASITHSVILFLDGDFVFPPLVKWWTPSLSHWSYNLVILTLNGLFQHTGEYILCTHLDWSLSTFISFYQHEDVNKIENVLNKEFSSLCQWFIDNKRSMSKSILFSKTRGLREINISFTSHSIKQHKTIEYLGCHLDSKLSGEAMASKVLKKINAN